MTPVIFRKWKSGEVIALFPQDPGTNDPATCMSYMHIGQHSAAHPDKVVSKTRAATEQEYHALLCELTAIGYDLQIRKIISRHDYALRQLEIYG